jgi:predicted nuclease with TOPRIM domain
MKTKYEELKERYEKLIAKNEAAKAKLEVYIAQLKELGCESVDAAQKKLIDLDAKAVKLGSKIDELTANIEAALNGKP